MARNQTLGQILEVLRIETGLDPDPALSVNVRPLLVQLIKHEYERLYDEFDWPFLRVSVDKPTVAGERYYDVPSDMDMERIETVDYSWGQTWHPLCRGIEPCDYNAHDSDLGVRADPAMKWDISHTGTREQVEIWPIPLTDGNAVRFTGIKKKTELIADADRCDLDATMIALFAASEYLASRDQAAAALKQRKAVERYRLLCGRSIQSRKSGFSFAGGGADNREERVPLVAYVRNP